MSLEWTGHLAFFLIALSFWLRDILLLRIVATLASFLTVVFNLFVPDDLNWMIINWNILFILIHGFRIGMIYREKRCIDFNREELEVFRSVFACLSEVEFMRVLKIGKWTKAAEGTVLANEGQQINELYVLVSGSALVERKNLKPKTLGPGTFIGEMGFTTDGNAKATVTLKEPSKLLVWESKKLKKLNRYNPMLSAHLQEAMAIDLTKKLTQNT